MSHKTPTTENTFRLMTEVFVIRFLMIFKKCNCKVSAPLEKVNTGVEVCVLRLINCVEGLLSGAHWGKLF